MIGLKENVIIGRLIPVEGKELKDVQELVKESSETEEVVPETESVPEPAAAL